MQRKIALLAAWVGLPLLLVFVSSAPAGSAQVLDRVVAKVNNEVILLSELYEFIRSDAYLQGQDAPNLNDSEKLQNYLNQLIEDKLVDEEAKRLNIEVEQDEVGKTIQRIMDENHLDQAGLESALQKEGLTLADYRDSLKKRLIKTRLINREVQSRVQVKDEDILQYYRRHPEKYSSNTALQLTQIFISCPGADNEEKCPEVKAKAEAAYKKIQQGADFQKTAAEIAPDAAQAVAEFREEELSPLFRRQLKDLKDGECTPAFASPHGYHILKLVQRAATEGKSLEQAKEEIRNILYEEYFRNNLDRWLNQLKEKTFIEILL